MQNAFAAWQCIASRSARAAHLLVLYLIRAVHRKLVGGWSRWQFTIAHAKLGVHRAADHSIRLPQRAQAMRLIHLCAKRWQRRRLAMACSCWRSSTVRLLTADARMKGHARRVIDAWSQLSWRYAARRAHREVQRLVNGASGQLAQAHKDRKFAEAAAQRSCAAASRKHGEKQCEFWRRTWLVGIARRWRFRQITVCWARWGARLAQLILVEKQRTRHMHTLFRRWQSYQIAGAFTTWYSCTCGRRVRLFHRVFGQLQRREHKAALWIWRRNIMADAAREVRQCQLMLPVFMRLRFDIVRMAWQHWRKWVRQLTLFSRVLVRLQRRSMIAALSLWSMRTGLLGQQCTILYRIRAHQCWRATMSAWRRWLWCITDQSKTLGASVGRVGSLERNLAHALREQVSLLYS